MTTAATPDPLLSFRFLVEIDGIARAAFQEVSGVDSEVEVVEYREGGETATMRKFAGQAKYSNIQLKWGMVADETELEEWHRSALRGAIERKNGSIVLLSTAGDEVARWNFIRAWPTKWTCPDLNAGGNDIAIETLELAHEGVERA